MTDDITHSVEIYCTVDQGNNHQQKQRIVSGIIVEYLGKQGHRVSQYQTRCDNNVVGIRLYTTEAGYNHLLELYNTNKWADTPLIKLCNPTKSPQFSPI